MTDVPAASLVQLVDSVELVLYGLACDGRILFANRRGLEITKLPREAVIGTDWRLLFASRERDEHVASLWSAVAPGHQSPPFEALCSTGRRLRWQFSYWALGGEPGVCAMGADVTDERDERARSKSFDRVSTFANLGAGLAHELRNPLNNANLQLMLLTRKLAKLADAAPLAPHVDAAMREIVRTAALIDDFLVFARPQQLALERVALAPLIERAVGRLQAAAAAAGARIEITPSPPVIVELCAVRVEDAVHNLVANAVDASRTAAVPTVTVRARLDGNAVVIEVADNGPGLAPDTPVFDAFYTTKPNGTGLGLAIVERVAIDHGGSVAFERSGDTTVFRLALPLISGTLGR